MNTASKQLAWVASIPAGLGLAYGIDRLISYPDLFDHPSGNLPGFLLMWVIGFFCARLILALFFWVVDALRAEQKTEKTKP